MARGPDRSGPDPARHDVSEPLLRAEGLRRTVGDLEIVADASFVIEAGAWVSLVGPSGCGKTSLLMMLGLLDRPDHGRLWLDGVDTTAWTPRARARARLGQIGFVFQTNNLLDHLTTRDNVALPAWRAGGSRANAERAADALLERFGLASRATTRAALLSTGEGQRAAIARALVNQPRLVLADEPTGSLDSASAAVVLEALREVTSGGTALVVATHDSTVAARGPEIAMRDGRIVDRRVESVA